MRLLTSILLVSTFATPFAALAAQSTANLQVVPTPSTTNPSALLKPAMDSIQQAITVARPEKWKVSNDTSQQTQANISSIQTDLRTTLPSLLEAADHSPNSAVQMLPAYRNVEALYDVLLRVAQVATLSAPAQQIGALQESVEALEKSRRALGDSIQTSALRQEQQNRDLQAQIHTLQAAPPPAAAPVACIPEAAPVKKRKPRPKPAQKPAAAATPQASAPAPH
jgi:hypothetical protein